MSVLGQLASCGETDSVSIFTVGIGTDLKQWVNKILRGILSFTLNVYLVVHRYLQVVWSSFHYLNTIFKYVKTRKSSRKHKVVTMKRSLVISEIETGL